MASGPLPVMWSTMLPMFPRVDATGSHPCRAASAIRLTGRRDVPWSASRSPDDVLLSY